MVTPTSNRTPEEADKAKKDLAVDTAVIVMVIVTTIQSLIIHLKEN